MRTKHNKRYTLMQCKVCGRVQTFDTPSVSNGKAVGICDACKVQRDWTDSNFETPTKRNMKHPIQPIGPDEIGTLRFKENAIVVKLLEVASTHGMDLNHIAGLGFSREDQMQLAQLIGYSVDGLFELSYVDDETKAAIDKMIEAGDDERDARILTLEQKLFYLRTNLVEPMAELFGVHQDDLRGQL